MLGVIVRRRERYFVLLEQFLARAKLSSLTSAGSGVSITPSADARGRYCYWTRLHCADAVLA
jgi:hypothetical protein